MRSLIRQIFPLVCCFGLFSLTTSGARAAEQISIRASGFERTVAVADLRRLVNTGELSDTLRGLLQTASLDANLVRGYLGASFDLRPFELNVTIIDKLLNSYLMELLLEDLAKSLRSPGDSGSVAAIKSAIIAGVADDSQISAIEFLEKYPTEMIVEVERLAQIQQRISRDYSDLAAPFGKLVQRLLTSR